MSTAFYPTNMRQQPGGGYNFNSTLQNIPYIPWKGTGIFRNPVGVTATHIRPLTNNDSGNIFPTGFGLPRPLKQYRKGTVIPVHYLLNPLPPTSEENVEKNLIQYNLNRAVKSSLGQSLGGGNGGTGLISQLMEIPGYVSIKDNGGSIITEGLSTSVITDNSGLDIEAECQNCNGVGFVSSWYPINNLTEKPEPNVTNPLLCCNQQRKAIQRVLPTNTNLKKNYYQTTYMYLYHRCQTFKQREFNFVRGPIDKNVLNLFLQYPFVTAKVLEYSKPGDPLSIANYYVAQCNPNFTVEQAVEIVFVGYLTKLLKEGDKIDETIYQTLNNNGPITIRDFIESLKTALTPHDYEQVIDYMYNVAADPYNGSFITGPSNPRGCAQVIYKPNNPQYAQQGGVSSSTRILKLNVDTITKSAYQRNKYNNVAVANLNTNLATDLAYGNPPQTPYILKDKAPTCQAQTYNGNPFFFSGQFQNKLTCLTKNDGSQYRNYNTVNNSSAGNYIGATQSLGGGYADKSQMPNTTYYDNIRHSFLNNMQFNLITQ